MLILDTDHISAIERDTRAGRSPVERLDRSGQQVAITIVSVDEQLRGLLSLIKRAREPGAVIREYERLRNYIEDLAAWSILGWTGDAERERDRFQRAKLRISTMDLRIACIALAHNATLLSRNLRDFRKVTGLRVEDWLAET